MPENNQYAQPESDPYNPITYTQSQEKTDVPITWTASEFIAHHKSTSWYLKLSAVAVLAGIIVFLLTQDYISVIVIIICAAALGVYAGREPRQLPYMLNDHGVQIGKKFFPFETFRSFALLPEGAFQTIVFVPLKRFSPLTTIYFAPNDEEKIITHLSDRLPLEERQHDAIDQLMQKIRF